MRSRQSQSAFTLLELVLVLVIIAVTMAVAAPSLRGWSRGARLRDAADEFLAVTRFARSQAVSECRTYRLSIDPAAGQYQLTAQNGEEFVELGSNRGRIYRMPEDCRLELVRPSEVTAARSSGISQSPAEAIDFHPTGRTTPAHVRIISGSGDAIDIQCATPAEQFRIISGAEANR